MIPPFCLVLVAMLFSQTPLAAQLIVAHRGASHDAPENTLAAFRLAFEQGADAIEGDFHLTRDGQIVCIHDEDTERTAGVKKRVADSTLAELRALDVGNWKHSKFAGEKIPILDEVLQTVPRDKQIFIEIKCGVEVIPHLKKVIASSRLKPTQLTIISFDDRVIAESKKAMPHVTAYWLTSFKQHKVTRQWSPQLASVLETLKNCKADGLDCKAIPQVVNSDFARSIRNQKLHLHCWTVDEPALGRQMCDLGVDSITTNRPRYLREQLKKTDSANFPQGQDNDKR